MDVFLLLYDGFTALDAFGPAEVLGSLDSWRIRCVSPAGGTVTSAQAIRVETEPLPDASGGVLLLPGGPGTRALVDDAAFLGALARAAAQAEWLLCVCTGSALAARAGLLDDKTATTNRRAFDWVAAQGPRTRWDRTARYTADGRVYTSAGVSAGIDMALGFVCDRFGPETAREIAARKEYRPAPEGRICGIDRPRRT